MSTSRLDEFEKHRVYLRGLAYRMTGSLADAEDLLQEAYLRYQNGDVGEVNNPRAYLSTLVTRLCLDQLKSARVRRETYVGPWLPEPVLDLAGVTSDETELAHDVSFALLMALERLSPLERAAFLLHDVFGVDYEGVAEAMGKSSAACRKLAERARAHVRESRPRYRPSAEESTRVMQAFFTAVQSGDATALGAVLTEDAVLYSDGGGKVPAALKPVFGRDKVTRFFIGLARRMPASWKLHFAEINGLVGVVIEENDAPIQTTAFEFSNGAIRAIYTVRNPDKLKSISSTGAAD
jgi:RNA polymerase sigma-70 factor (ECF subfamily)